jgi:hypothetical protein
VRVVAAEGGPAGNVESYRITRIEGPLAGQLEVQNNAPARGGTERATTFVTEDDRRKLYDSLHRTLSERLAQQLRAQLPATDNESVVAWNGQSPTVVEAAASKNVGDEAQSFSLTLKLHYGATVFANDAYNAFVQQYAAARIGELKPGYELVPGSLKPQAPDVLGVENSVVRLRARAQGTVSPVLDAGRLRRELANQPVAQAHAHLAALRGITGYELRHWPGWVGRLPWLGLRIDVQVALATPPATR